MQWAGHPLARAETEGDLCNGVAADSAAQVAKHIIRQLGQLTKWNKHTTMYMYMDMMSDDTNWSTNLQTALLYRSHQTKPSIKTSIASEFIVKLPATDKHPEK